MRFRFQCVSSILLCPLSFSLSRSVFNICDSVFVWSSASIRLWNPLPGRREGPRIIYNINTHFLFYCTQIDVIHHEMMPLDFPTFLCMQVYLYVCVYYFRFRKSSRVDFSQPQRSDRMMANYLFKKATKGYLCCGSFPFFPFFFSSSSLLVVVVRLISLQNSSV